jgi:phosphinothricin acetyltransferase
MSFAVDPMTEADWPAVSAIYAEGIATGHSTFEAAPPRTYADFCAGRLEVGRLVARDATGMVLGWTALARISARAVYAGVADVGIYVAAAARGRRVGSTLLRELIGRAEAAGIWTLQAGIFPENAASLALHERHGFHIVGRRERIGRMTFGPHAGRWRDTLLLERRSTVVGTG